MPHQEASSVLKVTLPFKQGSLNINLASSMPLLGAEGKDT